MRPSQKGIVGTFVFKGFLPQPAAPGGRNVGHVPTAGPHRHSAAGTPHCSPAAPAHTAAPASSLSETWGPGLRTPGGWVCWAHQQPSGSLETGGHNQPGSGGSLGRSPSSTPDPPTAAASTLTADRAARSSCNSLSGLPSTSHCPQGAGPAQAKRERAPSRPGARPSAGLAPPPQSQPSTRGKAEAVRHQHRCGWNGGEGGGHEQ